MRKNLLFYGSWLLALTFSFGMSTPISAQAQARTIAQVEGVKTKRKTVNSGREIINRSSKTYIASNRYATIVEGALVDGCDQGDDSNGFENGFNITSGSGYRSADDFFVSPNESLNVRSIVFNIFANYPVASVDMTFFNDDAGKPGSTIIEYKPGLIPYAQVPIGAAFGYTIYAIHVEVDLEFLGGASGTSFWMQPEVDSPMAFWEGSSAGTLGEVIHMSENMGPWLPDDDGGIHHGVFKLHCDVVNPPDPVCFGISDTVEPITRVVLSDIDNTSSPAIDASPGLEDFTYIEGVMARGEAYDIAVEGNTNGYLSFFTVWIDWNQNGEWETTEMYEIGSIFNSTGTDGQQATGTIPVPIDATLGSTTLRIIKNWDTSPTDPCDVYLYGQGEDYTIIVEDQLSIKDQSATAFSFYPNPIRGIVNFTTTKEISSIAVVNLLGQKVTVERSLENGLIDLSNLSTGAYMFRVIFKDGNVESFRVLKQ